jgi:hypothetical protein
MSPARSLALDGRRLSAEGFEPAKGTERARIDPHDGQQHSPIGRAAAAAVEAEQEFSHPNPSARTPAGGRTMQAQAYAYKTRR